MNFAVPTIEDLKDAREEFEENEPRDLFYRAATELVSRAFRGDSSLSIAEALAVLLQTWNQSFYRYRPFDSQHFSDIERLIRRHRQTLTAFKRRSIRSLRDKDENKVNDLFRDFEIILGPVGASKSLHLLVPRFFPLWDRAIAKAYGLALQKRGKNAKRYYLFMKITKEQCKYIGKEKLGKRNPLKALDEYNYCKFTREWI